jgi:hypothetical protein
MIRILSSGVTEPKSSNHFSTSVPLLPPPPPPSWGGCCFSLAAAAVDDTDEDDGDADVVADALSQLAISGKKNPGAKMVRMKAG